MKTKAVNGINGAKIEKLLRLAGSSNAHEAALAMAKAMELADRHAIDLHKIGTNAGAARFVVESLRLRKRVMLEVNMAAAICAEFFHCEVVVTRVWNGVNRNADYWFELEFIGEPAHVAVARYIHSFLVRSSREDFIAERLGKIPPVRPIRPLSLVTNRPEEALASLKAGFHEGLNTQLRPAIGREQEELFLS